MATRRRRRRTAMEARHHLLVWVCLFLIVSTALARPRALRYLYPLHYRDVLISEANRLGLDPLLLAAVARVESGFDPKAVSHKGALGVMQVMPSTGAWVASQLKLGRWQDEQLFDPATNIRIASWYLAYLRQLFDGEELLAIAAYNGGLGNVRKWISGGRWNGSSSQVSAIPFRETRTYVRRVLLTYEKYQQVYPELARRYH